MQAGLVGAFFEREPEGALERQRDAAKPLASAAVAPELVLVVHAQGDHGFEDVAFVGGARENELPSKKKCNIRPAARPQGMAMTSNFRQTTAPGARALARATNDERERDLAETDDAALVRYLNQWQRKLSRLQRRYPERWCVPGLSDEEVRDLLTLRLFEVVRAADTSTRQLQQPGKEWGLLVLRQGLGELHRNFKLRVTPGEINEAPAYRHAPNQEEQWLEEEAEQGRMRAQARAEGGLSVPQRRWLAALKLSARAGAFFAASDEPNLSAASRLLGKSRSSAQRAYQELKTRFGREFERID